MTRLQPGSIQMLLRSSLVKLVPFLLKSATTTTQAFLRFTRLGARFQSNLKMASSEYIFPNDQPVVYLECDGAFKNLTEAEKLYAHYLSRASWYGGLIVLYQTSAESPLIYLLLHKLYSSHSLDSLKSLALEKCQLTEDEFKALLVYSCGFYANMGNYKGFGDSKFIPNIPKEKLDSLLQALGDKEVLSTWASVKDLMYSLEDTQKHLGFSDKGTTTYFSKNCTKKDSELVNQFFKEKGLEAYNSRLFKIQPNKYEVRLASVASTGDNESQSLLGTHQLESIPGYEFVITRGDYSPLLSRVIQNLEKAKEHAANENENKMIAHYIQSFKTGSLDHHKDGSRYWIKDKGPVVETYIGFIETYRDPAGMRGEFEGFVAMVNKTMSRKFAELVEKAEKFLPLLPWPQAYEKDSFLRPDFTSLDVLTFAGSGIPAGICIPNCESPLQHIYHFWYILSLFGHQNEALCITLYGLLREQNVQLCVVVDDEVRQNEGFKNVSLGNVIPASYKDSAPNYLSPTDQELLQKLRVSSFELQVGLHELLGHGSGKLFQRNKDGSLNFDLENTINPLTSAKVDKYYEIGETYDSIFTSLGSSYEECRAECVGLYLCTDPKITKIFGCESAEAAEELVYVNWLSLLHSAVEGLQMYNPNSGTWLQAHSQARFVILQVLLEAGKGLVSLSPRTGADGRPDLLLSLDRTKISSVGHPALGTFLQKLQVYKATADLAKAREMYDAYSNVNEAYVGYRAVVMERKKPRKMFVQANTSLEGDRVALNTYESSPEGLIQSWVDRFRQDDSLPSAMLELYKKDVAHFSSN
ncbi:DPP3 [Cordylochernes scorpioides]|uniref:DPP3 n=1 Tax=Cordylochernes scorpioides TaxID=51811 RepID=A0ABY6LEZ0_9ARAC|nr:DPP3 [Cordylochernes scorpioides]